MSNYRRRNFVNPLPPMDPPTKAPTIQGTSKSLDEAVYLRFDYSGFDIETLTGYRVVVKVGAAVMRELFLESPNKDVEVTGLTNGTTYTFDCYAENPGGLGPVASVSLTPKPTTFPKPKLVTITAGNGYADVEWSLLNAPAGYELDSLAFEATRLDTEATVDGKVTSTGEKTGRIDLDNEVEWTVVLIAVFRKTADGNLFPSGASNAMTVTPTNPIPPYRPIITGASMGPKHDGYFDVTWEPGDRPLGSTGNPLDIIEWRVVVDRDTEDQRNFTPPGNVRTLTLAVGNVGKHTIDVSARNEIGWSDPSEPVEVEYKEFDTRPFTADRPFRGPFRDPNGLEYVYFDPGDDPDTEGDRIWRCTRTGPGAYIDLEVIAVGGGGGGKGQTMTLGKGGDGGGGELTLDTLPAPNAVTTFTVTLSTAGSQTRPDVRITQVSEKSYSVLAQPGKTATSGADADGYPPLRVPESVRPLAPFSWDAPKSEYVGGTVGPTDRNYPDGTYYGQGGAGTKTSKPGRGQQGVVVIRWQPLGLEDLDRRAPRYRWWKWWLR